MIVIYTQDNTIIKNNADAAKEDLIRIYGEKLGIEAYESVKGGCIGAVYRKYGGPLVKVISNEEAEIIIQNEEAVKKFSTWEECTN